MKIELGKIMYDALFGEENKTKIIKSLNEVINVPILGEKAEEKLITAVYDAISIVFKKLLVKEGD
jgi:hypothetical protein|tara:strand:- start:262 stop:456 length:195 start_codon:yes stop_codon:yes gene_type:complete